MSEKSVKDVESLIFLNISSCLLVFLCGFYANLSKREKNYELEGDCRKKRAREVKTEEERKDKRWEPA